MERVPPALKPLVDAYVRPLRSLRISVTDRCNLRCEYCMPQEEYTWLERNELLSFEEIAQLANIFAGRGVTKLRITGGEPLLRRDVQRLIAQLASCNKFSDIALTTNGLLLPKLAEPLRDAGLHRLTISLDTLRRDRFQRLTRRDELSGVLAGIDAAAAAGFHGTKLNAVIIRGFNDDEILDLLEFGRTHQLEVRFIEYMDVGGALRWSGEQVFSAREMLSVISARYGEPVPLGDQGSDPAGRYRLLDGTSFGIIASTTQPFCGACDRARLTADGMLLLCLYAEQGIDLKRLLRGGTAEHEILAAIASAWRARTDRGAEERLSVRNRQPLFQIQELRSDVHREMHTRGG